VAVAPIPEKALSFTLFFCSMYNQTGHIPFFQGLHRVSVYHHLTGFNNMHILLKGSFSSCHTVTVLCMSVLAVVFAPWANCLHVFGTRATVSCEERKHIWEHWVQKCTEPNSAPLHRSFYNFSFHSLLDSALTASLAQHRARQTASDIPLNFS